MEKRNCHRTSIEKLQIIQYSDKYGMDAACKKFDITERSIWRYKKLYNGNLDSLKNKSSKPNTPHPNEHTKEEIDNIKAILDNNPYISHKELYNRLISEYGYSRKISGLYSYLRRHNMIPEPKQKNEYATMFDLEAVKRLNNKFLYDNKAKLPLYIIELSNLGIYIASNVINYPCKLSVYYSVSLYFNKLEDAQNFVKSIKNTSNYTLNIKKLKL